MRSEANISEYECYAHRDVISTKVLSDSLQMLTTIVKCQFSTLLNALCFSLMHHWWHDPPPNPHFIQWPLTCVIHQDVKWFPWYLWQKQMQRCWRSLKRSGPNNKNKLIERVRGKKREKWPGESRRMKNERKRLNRSHHQTHTRAGFPFLTDSDKEDEKKEREGHRETRSESKTEWRCQTDSRGGKTTAQT